ncbi:phosphocholine cytidylyltransferase family protein [Pantoea stewartii]|uniref:phosphocholine cytidylyltransferase family protein n=1 Tax=Pantoea stewartii TaxID=66269 RepID=UPI00249DA846|nr:sugar phosphate nucleotidyltransferase [Pantoea stewartii]
MRIACLMAGLSSRLLPLTEKRHKACLSVGARRMIDYQLSAFDAAGIDKRTFVVGHGAPELVQVLLESQPHRGFELCYNPDFSARNLDWSAFCALSQQPGPVLYYEGDLLIPSSLLRDMANNTAEICIALDSTSLNPTMDTLVLAPNGKIERLLFIEHGTAERRQGDGALGEFICLVKLGEAARQFVVAELEKQPFQGAMQLYAIFERAFARFTTSWVDAAGRPWVEVDNADDLARAAKLAEEVARA